jgi:uncharacterized protein (DUF2141 family)
MKNLVIISLFLLFSNFSKAQETKTYTLTVNIDNISNNKGKVQLSLHKENTFMKGPGIQNIACIIKEGKITATFKNVTPGSFAILALHDENNNNQMDYETNGMPKESYGMSGNEMSYGPPNFEDAKFTLTDHNLEFNIRF